jgi:hypothetical protein
MGFALRMRMAALATVIGCWANGLALGDEKADEQDVAPTIELTVSPAAEPRPALKHRLMPTLSERKAGNAAPHYYRAIILQRQTTPAYRQEYSDKQAEWTEGPDDTFPKQEVAKWLAGQTSVISELKKAAYKEQCEWGFRYQDLRGPELYKILIPEIQACRDLARTLRLQARYEIIDGRYDDALESLRMGYQLAYDTAKNSLIVSALVGVAIEGLMDVELEHLIQRSSENYYWAIAALPEPVADVRPSLQVEMSAPFLVFPFLKDAETTVRSPDEWRQLIVRALTDLGDLGAPATLKGWQGELGAAALMTALYPAAKAELIAGGMSRERVEAMPVGQAVAVHTARATEATYHEIFKHTLMPHGEAMKRLPEVMKRLEKDTIRPDAGLSGKIGLPIANMFLPSIDGVIKAQIRASRNLAALQAIEALRMHAAQHGELPATLTQVSIVPVPVNPATGEAFPYSFDAATKTATLDVPPSAGRQARHEGKHYVIRLRK